MFEYLVYHLREAKRAAGSDEPLTVKDYFVHCVIALREAVSLLYKVWASVVHAFFPWLYGFEMIDWQIDALKRLKAALPSLPVWDRIEFKD